MERAVVEYVLNAMWQLPLLLLGACVLLRVIRAEPAAQHGVWMGVLALTVVLPLQSVKPLAARAPGSETARQRTGTKGLPSDGVIVVLRAEPAGRASREVFHEGTSWGERMTRAFETREIHISPRLTHWVVRLYIAALLLASGRLGQAWMAANRLVRESQPAVLCPEDRALLERGSARLGLAVLEVRVSEQVRTPGVVGMRRPVLLLPPDFGQCTREEARAALLHELAHLQRRDPMKQLLGEVGAVPVAWHPAVWQMKARLRQTREMACDTRAAAEMQTATGYARCLLTLAQRLNGNTGIASMAMVQLGDGDLEQRVLRLVSGGTAMGRRTRLVRMVCGVGVIGATLGVASAWHMQPTWAGTQGNHEQPALMVIQAEPLKGRTASTPLEPSPVRDEAGSAEETAAARPTLQTPPQPPAAPVAPIAPIAPVAMRPSAAKAPQPGQAFDLFGEGISKGRELTPEAEVRRTIEQANWAAARVNSPEFRKQMERAGRRAAEAEATMNSPEMRRSIEDATRQQAKVQEMMQSPEFQRQMKQAQESALKAQKLMDSPEFKQQMEAMRRQEATMRTMMQSPEFQKQMKQAQESALKAQTLMNSPEFQRQMEAVRRQEATMQKMMQSPEFRGLQDGAEQKGDGQKGTQGKGCSGTGTRDGGCSAPEPDQDPPF